MNRRSLLGTAVSTAAILAALSGCAVGQQKPESIFGSKVDRENIGLATRAQAALASKNYAMAVELAERAVQNTPNDAGFRGLLGNCYFASGRFASAAAAYRDSLSLIPNQPQLVLKLALVEIAQGRNSEALALLEAARNALDPADYGLAVALAGRADAAIAVLDEAARMIGADARVRQNLALAYGLAGDWAKARAVAEQDVPPEQLDSRIQQWMAMATPLHPYDQIAALTGVRPVADPGQPVRLALKRAPQDERSAEAAVPPSQPQQVAEVPAAPPPALPDPAPVQQAAEAPAAPPPALPDPAPVQQAAQADAPAPVSDVAGSLLQPETAEPASIEAPAVEAVAPAPLPQLPTRFDVPVEPAKYVAITDTIRRAAVSAHRTNGRSSAVVQLGAYSSPDRVAVAWERFTKRYPGLANYTPVRARFDGPKGTVWRLSVKGFASRQEAVSRCGQLQSRGGQCFVRQSAGDSPVQFASR